MGFFAWLLRRDEPVAEAPPSKLVNADHGPMAGHA
jgi:hypothetical protein